LAWKFVDGTTQLTSSPCEQLGAVAIRITATPIDAVDGTQFSFDCQDLQGTSPDIAPATYTLRIEVIASGLVVIGEPTFINDIEIRSNADEALGELTFDITRTGSATITLDSREPAGNCAAVDSDGAGLTAFNVLLTTRGNIPIDGAVIEVVNAAAPGGFDSFTNDTETQPMDLTGGGDCFEKDAVVTIRDVASGPVRLVVEGVQDTHGVCYQPSINPAVAYYDFSIVGGGTVIDLGNRILVHVLPETNNTCDFP